MAAPKDTNDGNVCITVCDEHDPHVVLDTIHARKDVLSGIPGFFASKRSYDGGDSVRLAVKRPFVPGVRQVVDWMHTRHFEPCTVSEAVLLMQTADMLAIDDLVSLCISRLKRWLARQHWSWWGPEGVRMIMNLPDVFCRAHVELKAFQVNLAMHTLTCAGRTSFDIIDEHAYTTMLSMPWYVMQHVVMCGKRSSGAHASICETNMMHVVMEWVLRGAGAGCVDQEKQVVFDNIHIHNVDPHFMGKFLVQDDLPMKEIRNMVEDRCDPWTWKASLLCMMASPAVNDVILPPRMRALGRDALVYYARSSYMAIWNAPFPDNIRFLANGCWFDMSIRAFESEPGSTICNMVSHCENRPGSYRVTVAFVDKEGDVDISPCKQLPNIVEMSNEHTEHYVAIDASAIRSVVILNVAMIMPSCGGNIFLGTM